MLGLVLAGGKSSRMGQDKGLISYYGTPQREYIAGILTKFCTMVYISCRAGDNATTNFPKLPDRFNIEGPLNGILTAFDEYSDDPWIVVAVDMPFVDEAVIKDLVIGRDATKVATCYYDAEGKNPEPLLSIWEPRALPFLTTFHQNGNISPRDFLKTHDVKIMVAPTKDVHTNINTPNDLSDFIRRKE
ncbi:MAG: molybdenum cofactor guanylyltransferase [Bacteroidota bacterium]